MPDGLVVPAFNNVVSVALEVCIRRSESILLSKISAACQPGQVTRLEKSRSFASLSPKARSFVGDRSKATNERTGVSGRNLHCSARMCELRIDLHPW